MHTYDMSTAGGWDISEDSSGSVIDKNKRHVGFVMNACSGFVNACIWTAAGVPTSHATGLMTTCAMALMKAKYYEFARMLIQLLCFVLGAFVSSCCTSNSTQRRGLNHAVVLGLVSLMLFVASRYSGPVELSAEVTNVGCSWLASAAAGMQNALTSSFSGLVMRTTHHTGTATDLGIELSKYATGKTANTKQLKMFCWLVGTFFAGAFLGTGGAALWNLRALMVPALVYGLLAAAAMLDVNLALGKGGGGKSGKALN
jgi:uncharacterized membrane protein YoaK (UPF0700 family)